MKIQVLFIVPEITIKANLWKKNIDVSRAQGLFHVIYFLDIV